AGRMLRATGHLVPPRPTLPHFAPPETDYRRPVTRVVVTFPAQSGWRKMGTRPLVTTADPPTSAPRRSAPPAERGSSDGRPGETLRPGPGWEAVGGRGTREWGAVVERQEGWREVAGQADGETTTARPVGSRRRRYT